MQIPFDLEKKNVYLLVRSRDEMVFLKGNRAEIASFCPITDDKSVMYILSLKGSSACSDKHQFVMQNKSTPGSIDFLCTARANSAQFRTIS